MLRSGSGAKVLRVHERLASAEESGMDATALFLWVPARDGYTAAVLGPAGLRGQGVLGPIPGDSGLRTRLTIALR